MKHRLKTANIEEALGLIDPVFLNTPQFCSDVLGSILGCKLLLKIETLNPIRSFKGRGGSYFVASLFESSKLVCASAGNFGQAMAYACRSKNIPLIVFASVNANPLKVDRIRALGGEVRLVGQDFDAAKLAAKEFAAQFGFRMVEDGLEPATGEGAGTIAVELLRWREKFDVILTPLGNGALLTGMGLWVKTHSPGTKMIGVAASGAPAMAESWRKGGIIQHPSINTIADGIAVRVPIPEVVWDMRECVDDIILVDDDSILQAMKLIHCHTGLAVEPSGAVGVAAILKNPERFANQLAAVILCGSNLTSDQMDRWLR